MRLYYELSEIYDAIYSQVFDYEKEADLVSSYLPKHSKILDIGTGTGTLASLLSDRGYYVTGIDISENMLDIARKKMFCLQFSENGYEKPEIKRLI